MRHAGYVRLFADVQGESHFAEVEVDLESVDFAPPAARALAAQGVPVGTTPDQNLVLTDVVTWVTNGITVVETELAGATMLVGEQFLDLLWDRSPVPFRLLAKIDLLAVYPNGIVESLDWKTGAARGLDQCQNVICRLVTEANAARLVGPHLPDGQPREIRTTVCHLGTQQVTVQVFERPQLTTEFAAIHDQIMRIEQAKSDPTPGSLPWRPQPGWLCRYCRYADACSYHNASGDDDALAWLHAGLSLPV